MEENKNPFHENEEKIIEENNTEENTKMETDSVEEDVENQEENKEDFEQKYEDLNNKYIRLAADFDNYRKRTVQ